MTSRAVRTGRRPGVSGTREGILVAAREEFAAHGYRGATYRGIAARAGVDTALIRYFYGHKEALFSATLELPDVPRRLVQALAGGPEGAGERLARSYLCFWEEPATRDRLVAILASVISNQDAMDRLRATLTASVLADSWTFLPDDRRQLRLALAASHLFGVAVARHLVKVPSLAAVDLELLVGIVAPVIDSYLTGPLEPEATAGSREDQWTLATR
jgi:AcrR family transcriptional regulator